MPPESPVSERGIANPYFSLKTSLTPFQACLPALVESSSDQLVMNTGYPGLDSILNGLKGGQVITIGGRTGMGKTAALVNLTVKLALQGIESLYFSGEMEPQEILLERFLPALTGKTCSQFDLRPECLEAINAGLSKASMLPVTFADIPSPSLSDIYAGWTENNFPRIIMVDYLQRCTLPHAESYRLRVKEFMVKIKNFARKTKTVVFLGSQLSRTTDARKQGERPRLSDLSESGDIENESDKVVLLNVPQKQRFISGTVDMEWIVAKNRKGSTKIHLLRFCKSAQEIREMTTEERGVYDVQQTGG